MLILTLRTDNPQAEIGLYEDTTRIVYEIWEAHRKLAETMHSKLDALLTSRSKTFADLEGIVMFAGPGSFTGLRIGISIGNALAASYRLPVVGTSGDSWMQAGIDRLLCGETETLVLPDYGSPAFVTTPRQ